jgi:hypothetical protein
MGRKLSLEAQAHRLEHPQWPFQVKKFIWIIIISAISLASIFTFRPAKAADFYVRDYGAVGDGVTNDQSAIQAAIDDAATNGGGSVIFDRVNNQGKYLTGNLYLKSGVTLLIHEDVQIIASTYIGDWDNHGCDTSGGGCNCDSDLMAPLIFADNVSNIAVQGGGTLVGTGQDMHGANGQLCEWRICGSGPGMIFLGDVSNATIQNITLRDAQTTGIVLAESENILVDRVNILTSTDWMCNDAIDIFGSQHVTISNNYIESGDDNIALKVSCSIYSARHMMRDLDCNNLEPVQDITIEGNTVFAPTGGSGLKIGWEVSGEVADVLWKDNTIRRGTEDPISIWVRFIDENKTSIHHVYYENNRYDNNEPIGGLSINGSQRDCQYYEIYWNGDMANYSDTAAQCGGSTCSCSTWQDQGCGEGNCGVGEMLQTRTCTPSGCNTTSRCVSKPICSAPLDEGDLNDDGTVNTLDIQLCVNVISRIETDPSIVEAADLDNDGVVDQVDLDLILVESYK